MDDIDGETVTIQSNTFGMLEFSPLFYWIVAYNFCEAVRLRTIVRETQFAIVNSLLHYYSYTIFAIVWRINNFHLLSELWYMVNW